MTANTSQKVVVVAGAVELAYVFADRNRAGGDATYRRAWGVGILTVALAAFADVVPEVAGPFALLVAVALLAREQGSLANTLGFGPGSSSRPKPAAGTTRGI